jgi:hypothetical protein
MAKYKVGDKVKIRKDLVVGCKYGRVTYFDSMEEEVSANGDNVLTIVRTGTDSSDVTWYEFEGLFFTYSEEMIEGLVEKKEIKNMKYKIGDKVKIREDLVTRRAYGKNTYVDSMKKIAKDHDYILTIANIVCNKEYKMEEDGDMYYWTDEMIERLVEPTDREKFEGCMRKLGRLNGDSDVWKSFDRLTYKDPNEDEKEFEEALKTVADYLFDTKKKMTKAEIEAELGYKIEIVEE